MQNKAKKMLIIILYTSLRFELSKQKKFEMCLSILILLKGKKN